jgi:hypothetical protein
MSLAASAMAKPLLQSHFTVKLIVSADGQMKPVVESDMTSQLQKISDVEVTPDDSAGWLIYMNVDPITDSKGVVGYVLSTVIADQYSANSLKALPAEDFKSPEIAASIKKLMDNQVNLRDHLVETCRPEDLQKVYALIANRFEQSFIMPVREDVQDFNLRRGFQ